MTEKIKSFLVNTGTLKLSVLSFLFAIVTSSIVMLLSGHNPISAFAAIFEGAFGGQSAIFRTLTQATPLIFTGLAFTVAKKATLINLGIEGQMYLGALASAVVGTTDLGLPMIVHLPLALICGMFAGGAYAMLVGFLKVRFGSNEVIATIMLNSIAIFFVDYLLNGPLQAENAPSAQTAQVLDTALLPRFVSSYQLTIAIIIAIVACIFVKYSIDKSVIGYEIRCVGQNKLAAETAGINSGKILIIAMLASGAIAGLAGSSHVLGVDRKLIAGFSPGYGFDGIAVAALAGDSPVGVIFAGLIFGALRAGSLILATVTDIPTEFVNVIQSLVVIFVAAPLLVKEVISPFNRKSTKREVQA